MLEPGARLGPYEIREQLDGGGMGDVYRATDVRLGRDVAVKLMKENLLDEEAVIRFDRESRALAALNHPNVVAIFDVGEHDRRPYLVTELLVGATLRQRLRALPPLDPWDVARQFAAGIAASHRQGVVHRDLKPENLFVTSAGTVKILDLGIAQRMSHPDPNPGASSLTGTTGYMAPEQIRGQPATFRSDIFSFGAILYEVCTGRQAFEGEDELARAYATLSREPPALESSGTLQEVIARCLRKDPAERFASGDELVHALDVAFAPVSRAPSTAVWDVGPATLHLEPTGFVGRHAEQEQLERLLEDPCVRLVTVTGPGGAGKTRLAVHVCERLRLHGARVVFVALAPLRDPALVVKAIARAFAIADASTENPVEAIAKQIGRERVLLVLDNFEHVVRAADDVAELIAITPALQVLVTSRAVLRIRGERVWTLAPMEAPAADEPIDEIGGKDAILLFCDRARAADPGFAADDSNLEDVAAICRRLGGLPLAIELAATHLRVLTPLELRERLDREAPLAMLSGGPRDVPEHQRALRSTFAWSYELLPPAARAAFRALSVFAGGFTLAGAQQVAMPSVDAAAALSLIEELADNSLLQRRVAHGRRRLALLEPLREFGHEQLVAEGESSEAERRHAHWVLEVVERWEPVLGSPRQLDALEHLEDEHANLRVALDWAMARGEGVLALRLATAVALFWQLRGYWQEGQRRLEAAIALGSDRATDRDRARALTALGYLTWSLGLLTDAERALKSAISIFRATGDPPGLASALMRLSFTEMHRGELHEGERLADEAVALFRSAGDRRGLGEALFHRGVAAMWSERLSEASGIFEDALAQLEGLGDPATIAVVRNGQGEVARARGELERARGCYGEALALAREIGHQRLIGATSGNLAVVERYLGHHATSARLTRESIRVDCAIGSLKNTAYGFLAMAGLALDEGQVERAVMLLEACEKQHRLLGARLDYSDRLEFDRILRACQDALHDPVRFGQLLARGDALSFDQAVDLALQPVVA
jgi:non-specific serine/threonine protein kinase